MVTTKVRPYLYLNGKWNTYTVNKDGEMNQIVYQQDMVSLLDDLIIDGGGAPEA